MSSTREKPPIELAARALCRVRNLPEDIRFGGAPLWHDLVREAMAVLAAVMPKEDLDRLVPGYPSIELYDPQKMAED